MIVILVQRPSTMKRRAVFKIFGKEVHVCVGRDIVDCRLLFVVC